VVTHGSLLLATSQASQRKSLKFLPRASPRGNARVPHGAHPQKLAADRHDRPNFAGRDLITLISLAKPRLDTKSSPSVPSRSAGRTDPTRSALRTELWRQLRHIPAPPAQEPRPQKPGPSRVRSLARRMLRQEDIGSNARAGWLCLRPCAHILLMSGHYRGKAGERGRQKRALLRPTHQSEAATGTIATAKRRAGGQAQEEPRTSRRAGSGPGEQKRHKRRGLAGPSRRLDDQTDRATDGRLPGEGGQQVGARCLQTHRPRARWGRFDSTGHLRACLRGAHNVDSPP
jgi:hypothetical protein